MSQQDVEPSGTQYKSSTEQLHIKDEPETLNEDTPHVHRDSGGFLEITVSGPTITIKDEPNDDEVTDDTQLKSDIPTSNVKEEPLEESHSTEDDPLFLLSSNEGAMLLKQSNHSFCLVPVTSQTVEVSVEHSEQNNIFQCNICEQTFPLLRDLQAHVRIHTGERPFKCDKCNKAFSHSGNLESHSHIHNGEKPYTCKYCGRTFKQLSSLRLHNLSHNLNKPYRCNTCDKRFQDASELKTHISTHTAGRPFMCDTCNMTFRQEKSFEAHLLIHTDIKPYKCDICDKSFKRPATLVGHKRTHSSNTPYKCKFCEKCFKLPHYMMSHQRNVHRDEMSDSD